MSSQKGNACRSRSQKYKNTTAFKNDKYGASVQVKIANAKVHAGLCKRCKEVLEWKVKYNKYKPLTQARTCVKCSQKTIKDAYHVICTPCSMQLEVCAKCGKKEDIVIPVNAPEGEEEDNNAQKTKELGLKKKKKKKEEEEELDDELDSDDDFGNPGSDDDDEEEEDDGSGGDKPKEAGDKAGIPDMARVRVQD